MTELKEYTLKKYTCGYCGYKFEAHVLNEETVKHVKHGYSTPVTCPFCHNNLKTWDEGEFIRIDKIKPRDKITPRDRGKNDEM